MNEKAPAQNSRLTDAGLQASWGSQPRSRACNGQRLTQSPSSRSGFNAEAGASRQRINSVKKSRHRDRIASGLNTRCICYKPSSLLPLLCTNALRLSQEKRESEREKDRACGTGISFEEPNSTGSRPSDLIGLYKQQTKSHPPNMPERARGKQPRKGKAAQTAQR